MAAPDDSPRQSAGWVVAAIVAVVAVCAVSFMITQRPREAIAVAQGDPLTGETMRGPQTAANTPTAAPPSLRARTTPSAGAAPKNAAAAMPNSALDANAAAVNASAVETDR